MDDRKHSISPHDLYARLGSEAASITVEVRRDADFVGADTRLTDAFHGSPDQVEDWRDDLPNGRQIVTCCVHGGQVSQGVAAALRMMGVEANFLEGGIAGWTELGLPTRRNIGATPSKWVTREHRICDIKDWALDDLATVVRGADTSRHELSPQKRYPTRDESHFGPRATA
jgi:rhodanese-related sulfurtransferase